VDRIVIMHPDGMAVVPEIPQSLSSVHSFEMLWGRQVKAWHPSAAETRGSCPPMSYRNDQSKKSSTAFDPASTLVAVVELSSNSWLVAGIVPGIDRHPLKKLAADENGLLALLHRWQQWAVKTGREIKRVVVAFEAGRDGFWLAR
jgi:hypothetical protein